MTTQVRPLFTPIPNKVSPELKRHLAYVQDAIRELRNRTGGSYDLGFGQLTDPNLNALVFWDNDEERLTFVEVADGLAFNGSDQITTNDSEINHDSLLNFEANEHIDHSAVEVSTGLGLDGGGDLTQTRTIALNTSNTRNADHNNIEITAGNGLSGGGDITETRTLEIDTSVVIDKSGIPTYTPTGGSTDRTFDANAAAGSISNPPTQAEVENIRDAVLELADVVATLVSDLGLS